MILSSLDAPVFDTPNARMRTLTSPSRGGHELALWRVEMEGGQSGPEHCVDREQVWVVLEGRLQATIDGQTETALAGDTLVLPVDVTRQIRAQDKLLAIVASAAAPRVTTPAQGTRPLPWAA